jgi:streptogramin lyase
LQDIATGRGLTTNDVQARVQGTWRADDVEQYMAGTSLPDWAFVQGFAKVVARSKWHQVDIERRVRPAWEAAARGGSPSTPKQADSVVRRRVAVGITAAVLATVGVILGVVLTSPGPSGTITNPPSGAGNVAVHKNLQVSGTAQDIPSGYRLDLFLQFVNSGNGIRYYIAADPNSAISPHNGHWAAPIFIGGSGPIIIRLVLLSPNEIAYVNSQVGYQNAGFPSLPGTVLASASYTAQTPSASTTPQSPQPSTSGATGNQQAVMPTASNCSAPHRVSVRDVALSGGLTATEFVLPQGSQPVELAADQHGNFWFTEFGSDKIGWLSPDHTFVECHIPTPGAHPFAIAAGPDRNMWFTEGNPDQPSAGGNKIGMITPQGQITEYPIPTPDSAPVGITKGPDGNLWFTEYQTSKIGRITVTGTITEFSLPSGGQPDQITTGPDGNLWFTEFSGNKIGRLTPGGTLSEFPTSSAGNPVGIVSRDGTLWFAQVDDGLIGRMTTGGTILGWISVPNREQPGPANFAVDRHDAVWFTEVQSGLVGYIANTKPLSVNHEYAVTGNGSLLIDIIIGPDGNPWFTVQGAGLIGRIARPLRSERVLVLQR